MDAEVSTASSSESECSPPDADIRTPCFANGRSVFHPPPLGTLGRSAVVPNQEGAPSMRPTVLRFALLAAALGSLLVPSAASAVATESQIHESISKGLTYLKAQQKESGEIAGFG